MARAFTSHKCSRHENGILHRPVMNSVLNGGAVIAETKKIIQFVKETILALIITCWKLIQGDTGWTGIWKVTTGRLQFEVKLK